MGASTLVPASSVTVLLALLSPRPPWAGRGVATIEKAGEPASLDAGSP